MATVSITSFPGTGSAAPTDTTVYTAAQSPATVEDLQTPCGCGCGCSDAVISPADIANAMRRARTIQVLTLIFWLLLIILLLRALFK